MSTLFIIRHAPYQTLVSREALDAIMICASFGQQVNVLFIDDGVWQLQAPKTDALDVLKEKNISKNWQALPLFDIPKEHTYLCHRSLLHSGLTQDKMILDTHIIAVEQIQRLIKNSTHVVTF